METYYQVNNVRTWSKELGHGEPLLMLHPGGVDSSAFAANIDALAAQFHLYLPERRGHGHTPDTQGPFSFELMAEDTIHYIEKVIKQPVAILGYSDGASIALLVARMRPDLVCKLVFVAGVFHRDEWLPEAKDENTVVPQFMTDMYGAVSPDGVGHYPTVVAKLARMHREGPTLSTDELREIVTRTLGMIGDDDEVSLEHATLLYRSLPKAELAIVPGTSHGLMPEKPDLCNKMIIDFLLQDPIQTFAPIRRA